ncbi:MAG: radical SAM protein [Bacteroidales bacterium]|nr:radical SAM protein [Bacteroidales bacterium]
MPSLNLTNLASGGLITNYYCTSKCSHCLYACSPSWDKKYIDKQCALDSFRIIKRLNCNSVHIGGGEPFLNFDGLKDVISAANEACIKIEYIETNSSWFTSSEDAFLKLNEIKQLGVNALLLSMSPFHNQHIPFNKVKGLMEACRKSGVSIIPWIEEFFNEINSFDDSKIHTSNEYTEKYGGNYFYNIPARYWIHFGGRAIQFFKNIFPLKDFDDIIFSSSRCSELADTSHFHFDLFNNYIPGLCSGIAINASDLGNPLNENEYPIINSLYNKGINGFFQYAVKHYNYKPSENKFLNKCHLCIDIRKHIINECDTEVKELAPKEFYFNI